MQRICLLVLFAAGTTSLASGPAMPYSDITVGYTDEQFIQKFRYDLTLLEVGTEQSDRQKLQKLATLAVELAHVRKRLELRRESAARQYHALEADLAASTARSTIADKQDEILIEQTLRALALLEEVNALAAECHRLEKKQKSLIFSLKSSRTRRKSK